MQVLVPETKERLVLALPVLQDVALVALKEQNLDPVFDLSGAQAQLQLEIEDAILGGPAELLLLGVGIADSHRDGGGALHLHTLVVVLVVDQKGAAVWRRAQNGVSSIKHTSISEINNLSSTRQTDKVQIQVCRLPTYVCCYVKDLQEQEEHGEAGGRQHRWRLQEGENEESVGMKRQESFQVMRGRMWCVCVCVQKVCDCEQQRHRDTALSPLNLTNGHPVTWGAAGTTANSMSFQIFFFFFCKGAGRGKSNVQQSGEDRHTQRQKTNFGCILGVINLKKNNFKNSVFI